MAFGRRRTRPSLIQTAARTAVITGTAAATSSAVHGRAARKQAETAAVAPPPVAAPAAVPLATAPAAASTTGAGPTDLLDQLERLGRLHTDGVLTDAEFAALKSKLIAG